VCSGNWTWNVCINVPLLLAATQVDIILERIEPDNMKEALQNTQDEIENLRSLLKKSEEELKESHARVDELHSE
jgi:hypothetical protein